MKIRRDGAEKLRDAGRDVMLHQNDVSRVQVLSVVLYENNLFLNALSKKASPSAKVVEGTVAKLRTTFPYQVLCKKKFLFAGFSKYWLGGAGQKAVERRTERKWKLKMARDGTKIDEKRDGTHDLLPHEALMRTVIF